MSKPTKPERWDEPIAEGLWQYELLFGAPRFMVAVLLPLLAAGLMTSRYYALAGGVIHGLAIVATRVEPEWPQIVWGLLFEPSELEP